MLLMPIDTPSKRNRGLHRCSSRRVHQSETDCAGNSLLRGGMFGGHQEGSLPRAGYSWLHPLGPERPGGLPRATSGNERRDAAFRKCSQGGFKVPGPSICPKLLRIHHQSPCRARNARRGINLRCTGDGVTGGKDRKGLVLLKENVLLEASAAEVHSIKARIIRPLHEGTNTLAPPKSKGAVRSKVAATSRKVSQCLFMNSSFPSAARERFGVWIVWRTMESPEASRLHDMVHLEHK